MSVELSLTNQPVAEKKQTKKRGAIAPEDMEVLSALAKIKAELNFVYRNLDYTTNPILIDSYIYEIKSLHMRYQFYNQICKEKGLASQLFG